MQHSACGKWDATSSAQVSASAVYLQTNHLDLVRTLLLCIASICIIAWLNLSNDVFDSQTGVDTNKPESVVNLTGSRRVMTRW